MALCRDNDSSTLSEDVMTEILLRLPVKSLLRFKCVSKHWYKLIKSPRFIDHHFNHDSNKSSLLIYHYRRQLHRRIFSLCEDEMFSRLEEPEHLQFPFLVHIIGPLNGIFCVFNCRGGDWVGHGALWNPATREFHAIPVSRPNVPSYYFPTKEEIGLGLDPLTNNYKVVRIFWDENIDHNAPNPSLISVYDSGTDSWRHFEDNDLVIKDLKEPLGNTYLNGSYYWLMDDCSRNYAVLEFDMSTEVYKEIEVPDCVDSHCVYLTLYDNALSMLSFDENEVRKSVDVWVMKEEGCWIKQFTLGPRLNINWPLMFWKNGEIFLESNSHALILFNLNTSECRNIGVSRESRNCDLFVYKESLVPIKGQSDFPSIQNFFELQPMPM
ncbi:hypothetical protein ACJIZ3_014614 [Penstemon smallii]|uniref:F-box domain-containing protein n=1 Tax=Penstemon smallii TaxID=265156 RepID=A0ABD3RNH9_9LAMI